MHPIPYLDIPALHLVAGHVRVPGSKSISNRALLLAALCKGTTTLRGVLDSDDTQVMLAALVKLGCSIKYVCADDIAQGITVHGLGVQSQQKNQPNKPTPTPESIELFLGNAGTVMRPLTAVLSLLGASYQLSGIPRMHERPIGDLVNALRSFGACIDCTGNEGYPPLHIKPAQINTTLFKKPIQVKGNTSSQFLSALLLALPLVAQEDIVIEVVGELISQPYIAITLKLLSDFGIHVENKNNQQFIIPAQSQYHSPKHYDVEGDASSASYFIAAGAIAARSDAPLIIEGIGACSIQGDIRFVEAARAMGASVQALPNQLIVHRGSWPLKAIDLDCNHIPDAAMTLAVMALYAKGTTRLHNIGSWRVKETDRLAAMKNELIKLGAQVSIGDDFIEVTAPAQWQTAAIHTYDDHRVAMCFSLAAFNPQDLPIRLLEPACVNKTYPGYFDHFFQIAKTNQASIPVIAIDGPSASGKGTLASQLAHTLGYHYLDSGVLYRVTALAALQEGISTEDVDALANLAKTLSVSFKADQVLYKGNDVSEQVRAEQVGMIASKIAVYPPVREALFNLQRSFQRLPGLVADGRDMGTVIFPEACLKVFLTAKAKAREMRRYKQLKAKGILAKIDDLHADLQARDEQDMNRLTSPLKPAHDAHLLDNSELGIEQSVQQVLSWWEALQPFK